MKFLNRIALCTCILSLIIFASPVAVKAEEDSNTNILETKVSDEKTVNIISVTNEKTFETETIIEHLYKNGDSYYEIYSSDNTLIGTVMSTGDKLVVTQNGVPLNLFVEIIDSPPEKNNNVSLFSWVYGNWNYKHYSYKHKNAATSIIATALSALLKQPYSVVAPIASILINTNRPEVWFTAKTRHTYNIRLEESNYEGYIYTYSDSKRKNLINTKWFRRSVAWD